MASRSHLFQPGVSGNPNGRPKGSAIVRRRMEAWDVVVLNRLQKLLSEDPATMGHERLGRWLQAVKIWMDVVVGKPKEQDVPEDLIERTKTWFRNWEAAHRKAEEVDGETLPRPGSEGRSVGPTPSLSLVDVHARAETGELPASRRDGPPPGTTEPGDIE